jgi:ribonuclease Z
LGLSLKERFHVHIIKERLKELGLPVGPWLTQFKATLYQKEDLQSPFLVKWKDSSQKIREREFRLGDLTRQVAKISSGLKLTYITDVVGSQENYGKIVALASGSDILFIEAAFLDEEKDAARKKYHLTAKQAGEIAKKAGVRRFHVFHFSPRYRPHTEKLRREAMEAFDKTEVIEEASRGESGGSDDEWFNELIRS